MQFDMCTKNKKGMAGTDYSSFIDSLLELNKNRSVPQYLVEKINAKSESALLKKLFSTPLGLNVNENNSLSQEELKYIHETEMDIALIDYTSLTENKYNIDLTNRAYLESLCRVPILYMHEAIESDTLFVYVSIMSTFNHVFLMKEGDVDTVNLSKHIVNEVSDIPAGQVVHGLGRIKRRFLMLNCLWKSLKDKKYGRVLKHIGNIILCLMVILCKRLIKIINSACEVNAEDSLFDVSFLIPHLNGMPDDLFVALSNSIIKQKVKVRCIEDREFAVSMFSNIEKKYNSRMWECSSDVMQIQMEGDSFCRLKLVEDMFSTHYTHYILTEAASFLKEKVGMGIDGDGACETESSDTSTGNFLFQMFKYYSDFKWIGTVVSSWKLPADNASLTLSAIHEHIEIHWDDMCIKSSSQMLFCGHVLKRAFDQNEIGDNNNVHLLKTLMYVARGTIQSKVQPVLFESLVKKCKESKLLKVYDVKRLSMFCLNEENVPVEMIEILIDEYQWVPKTWLSEEGNTLLGVIVGKESLAGRILTDRFMSKKHVIEGINLPSRYDHMTPLMIAANYCDKQRSHAAVKLITSGCDVNFVNKNRECVLHRAACFNNYMLIELFFNNPAVRNHTKELSKLVDLRRSLDGTTPLMIALARNHIAFAAAYYNLYHPKVKILMGKSMALGIFEYLVLSNEMKSVRFLQLKGHTFDYRGINNAKDTIPGYSLGLEEVLCEGSGLKNEGRGAGRHGQALFGWGKKGRHADPAGADARPLWSPFYLSHFIQVRGTNKRGEIIRDLVEGDVHLTPPLSGNKRSCIICGKSQRNTGCSSARRKINFNVRGETRDCRHEICTGCTFMYRLKMLHNRDGCVVCRYLDISSQEVNAAKQVPIFEKESTDTVVPSEQIIYKEVSDNTFMLFIDGQWLQEYALCCSSD